MSGTDERKANSNFAIKTARRLFEIWAAWQLLNIVGNIENLFDLSESAHKIFGWWAYLTGVIFSFFSIDLSIWQRNFVILVLLLLGAANIALRLDGRRDIFQVIWLALHNPVQALTEMVDVGTKYGRFAKIAGLSTLAVAYLLYKYYEAGVSVGETPSDPAYRFSLMALMVLGVGFFAISGTRSYIKQIEEFEKDPSSVARPWVYRVIIFVTCLNAALAGFFPFVIVKYRAKILKMLGIFLAFLLMELFFTYIFDPLAPFLVDLPEAPALDY